MANNLTNANLSFKYGLETSLATLRTDAGRAKIEPGTFYITSDTNRMYLGVSTDSGNDIVNLNQGVTPVETLNALPNDPNLITGQFYYVKEGNILCVYSGKKWVQINPDTFISSITTEVKPNNATDGTKDVVVTATFNQTNAEAGQAPLIHTWVLNVDKSFDVAVTKNGNDPYIIKLSNKQQLEAVNGTNAAKIELQDGANNALSTITITGHDGTNEHIPVSVTDDGEIFIDGQDLYDQDIATIDYQIQNGTFSTNLARKIAGGTTVALADANKAGFHPIIKYGADPTNLSEAQFANITGESNNKAAATLSVYTKAEMDNLLTTKMQDLDAVKYIGTIEEDWIKDLESGKIFYPPTTKVADGVSKGYAFKVGSSAYRKITTTGIYYATQLENSTGAEWADVGDLLIANGTETNDIIPQDAIYWDWIPSGDDLIYRGEAIPNGIQIVEKTASNAEPISTVAKITFAGGKTNDITAYTDENNLIHVSSSSAGATEEQTITISHALAYNASADEEETTSQSGATKNNNKWTTTTDIDTVESIAVTAEGHVRSMSTNKVTLIDTNASLQEHQFSTQQETTDKKVKIANTVSLLHPSDANTPDTITALLYLESENDNLKVQSELATDGNPVVNFSLVWGSF